MTGGVLIGFGISYTWHWMLTLDGNYSGDGYLINKIKVYGDETGIRGIELDYSDGNFIEVGRIAGDPVQVEWDPAADTIEELRVWEFPEGTTTGTISHIKIGVSNGQSLDAGKNVTEEVGMRLHVGSGMLLGLCGDSSDSAQATPPPSSGGDDDDDDNDDDDDDDGNDDDDDDDDGDKGGDGDIESGLFVRHLQWIFATQPVEKVSYDNMTFTPTFESLNDMASNK